MDPFSPQSAGVSEPTSATLTREQILPRLREVPLFQGLTEDDLAQILSVSEPVRVDEGEVVFEQGERGDHFFVVVGGRIELGKVEGGRTRRLAVLEAGRAFGEMTLLNQTPRSARARAIEDTYLLSVSRDAFSGLLGGDTLAVRLLKNLARELWATSVRLATQKTEQRTVASEEEAQSLADFNRVLRARLLPRVTPRVSGFDLAGSTLATQHAAGATSWDWFVLADGRPGFAVMEAGTPDVLCAQRMAGVRTLIRSAAAEPHVTLGALLTRVNRYVRAGWVEGLSGAVSVGLVALADGAAEWAEAGSVQGRLMRVSGRQELLGSETPALGVEAERSFESTMIVLAENDRIVMLSGASPSGCDVACSALSELIEAESQVALSALLAGLEPVSGPDGQLDVSGVLVRRLRPARPVGILG